MRGELTIFFGLEEDSEEINMFMHIPDSDDVEDALEKVVDIIKKEAEGREGVHEGGAALRLEEIGMALLISFTFKDGDIVCQTVH